MKKTLFTLFLIGALTFTVGCKKTAATDKPVGTADPEVTQEIQAEAEPTESVEASSEPENTEPSTETTPETTQVAEKCEEILLVPDSELAGEYVDENGDVNLKVEQTDNGYHIEIGIFRLTEIDDGKGKLDGDKIVFTATDASGSPIEGEVVKTKEGADVVFTNSTWEYIKNGDRFPYFTK